MVKAFFPIRSIDVPASEPHPPKTNYRVSIGWEHWGGHEPVHVTKIQMCYSGRVSGRKSPSFPAGSPDLENVTQALKDIGKGQGVSGRGKISRAGGLIVKN